MIFKFKNGYTVKITDAKGKSFDELREIAKQSVYEVSKHKLKDAHRDKVDSDKARDLFIIASNSEKIYKQQILPVIENLAKKKKKGIFDKELAIKAFLPIAKTASMLNAKENGETFTPADREEAARQLLEFFMEDIDNASKNNKIHDAKIDGLDGSNVRKENLEVGQMWNNTDNTQTMKILEINGRDLTVGLDNNLFNGYTHTVEKMGIYDFLSIIGKKKFYNDTSMIWTCDGTSPVRDDDYEEVNDTIPMIESACDTVIEEMANVYNADFIDEREISDKERVLIFELPRERKVSISYVGGFYFAEVTKTEGNIVEITVKVR